MVLKSGTLQMAAADVATRTNITWMVDAATGTGILTADGFSFAGKTVSFSLGTGLDREKVHVLTTGTTGIPTAAGLTGGWKLAQRDGSLILHRPPPGTVISVK